MTAIDVPVARGRVRALALTRRVGTAVVIAASAVWAIGYAVPRQGALDR
jgi:hypothetical protein